MTTKNCKNTGLNIKEWAKEAAQEHRNTINFYIREGIEKNKAVEMVLSSSTLGSGIKAQIRYEYK